MVLRLRKGGAHAAYKRDREYNVILPRYQSSFAKGGTPQVFGGAELRQEVGDALASVGVSLIIVYGWCVSFAVPSLYAGADQVGMECSTEVGAIANVIPGRLVPFQMV